MSNPVPKKIYTSFQAAFAKWRSIVDRVMERFQIIILLGLFIFLICPIGLLLRLKGKAELEGFLKPDEGSNDFTKLY